VEKPETNLGETDIVKNIDELGFSKLPGEMQNEIIAKAGRAKSKREIEEIAKEIEANLKKLR
jgi:hypothetical protein